MEKLIKVWLWVLNILAFGLFEKEKLKLYEKRDEDFDTINKLKRDKAALELKIKYLQGERTYPCVTKLTKELDNINPLPATVMDSTTLKEFLTSSSSDSLFVDEESLARSIEVDLNIKDSFDKPYSNESKYTYQPPIETERTIPSYETHSPSHTQTLSSSHTTDWGPTHSHTPSSHSDHSSSSSWDSGSSHSHSSSYDSGSSSDSSSSSSWSE